MFLKQKIVFLFNKFFISFLKDLKESSDDIKQNIKKNYKIVDKSSTEHIQLFWDSWKTSVENVSSDSFDKTTVDTITFMKGDICVGDIIKQLPDTEVETFWNHIYTMLVFSYLYNEVDDSQVDTEVVSDEDKEDVDVEDLDDLLEKVADDNIKGEQVETLFTKVVEVLGMIQRGEDAKSELDEILDDEVKGIMCKITKKGSKNSEKVSEDDKKFNMDNLFGDMAANSKIANLAKEISEEIDVSNIKIDKPEDIMKMMDFSSSNNVMGDIIKKVSSKITDKIQTGQLNQEDLLGEAMSMMNMMGTGGLGGLGNLFNNPMMGEMMKAMKKGKPVQTRQDVVKSASARDRLRRKLDERRSKQ